MLIRSIYKIFNIQISTDDTEFRGLNFVYVDLRVTAFEMHESCRLGSFADVEVGRFQVTHS